ncbi:precorrin-4 C(11)-methyltransferase [Candidatus Endowatersipora endosymbiont of Watersipora subatra]|uniref:precorrin-4 C(11)-methyltransferase n=1 Tax=Candidatus Endowatersipora endosymbiont of Watersipora subatra TaxID=3077946 RepID=UPI00312C8219
MKVYFIGAGPGAPDLITVRGLKFVKTCPVCLYAGSLVPKELVALAPSDALIMDTAPMHLESIIEVIQSAHRCNQNVARLHSGDPSIYGAIAEQMRWLDRIGVSYEVVPGVPTFAAVAAKLKTELTLPEIAQTVIITRTRMKASVMPDHEQLEILGRSRSTLAIHLSIRNLPYIRKALEPYYKSDCPVVIAYRATWPDELYIRTTLSKMNQDVRKVKITRTALVLIGSVLGDVKFRDSDLYNPNYKHVLRNYAKKD